LLFGFVFFAGPCFSKANGMDSINFSETDISFNYPAKWKQKPNGVHGTDFMLSDRFGFSLIHNDNIGSIDVYAETMKNHQGNWWQFLQDRSG